jgi:hypothetical protein
MAARREKFEAAAFDKPGPDAPAPGLPSREHDHGHPEGDPRIAGLFDLGSRGRSRRRERVRCLSLSYLQLHL